MKRSIIASFALATLLVIGCEKKVETPAELPAVNADSLAQVEAQAKMKADSMLQASKDSIARVDSMMQANDKKPGAKKPAPKKNVEVAPPTNTDGSATPTKKPNPR